MSRVFTNGVSKEAKEKTTSKLANHGFLAEKHLQSFA